MDNESAFRKREEFADLEGEESVGVLEGRERDSARLRNLEGRIFLINNLDQLQFSEARDTENTLSFSDLSQEERNQVIQAITSGRLSRLDGNQYRIEYPSGRRRNDFTAIFRFGTSICVNLNTQVVGDGYFENDLTPEEIQLLQNTASQYRSILNENTQIERVQQSFTGRLDLLNNLDQLQFSEAINTENTLSFSDLNQEERNQVIQAITSGRLTRLQGSNQYRIEYPSGRRRNDFTAIFRFGTSICVNLNTQVVGDGYFENDLTPEEIQLLESSASSERSVISESAQSERNQRNFEGRLSLLRDLENLQFSEARDTENTLSFSDLSQEERNQVIQAITSGRLSRLDGNQYRIEYPSGRRRNDFTAIFRFGTSICVNLNTQVVGDGYFENDLTPEEIQLLQNTANLYSGSNEADRQILNNLTTPNSDSERVLDTLREQQSSGSQDNAMSFIPNTEQILSTRTRINNRVEFWRLVNSGTSFEELEAFVARLPVNEELDQQLAQELSLRASQIERSNLLRQLADAVASNDFDRAQQVNERINSLDQQDISLQRGPGNATAVCIEFANRVELANIRRRVMELEQAETPRSDIDQFIEDQSDRPFAGSESYVDRLIAIRNESRERYRLFDRRSLFRFAESARAIYETSEPQDVIAYIDAIELDSEEGEIVRRQVFEEYGTYLATARPAEYTETLKPLIDQKLRESAEARLYNFDFGEEGRNDAAYEYLKQNFGGSIFVLFRTLEGNKELRKRLRKYIVGKDGDGAKIKEGFTIELERVLKERDLDPIEEAYFRSVEQLSKLNPWAAALLAEAFGETDEFVRNHLDRMSQETWDCIEDGAYVPALQFGTGPNGLAYHGEVVRTNPALAAETLIVDGAEYPGGPFAIPNGPAWDLNSGKFTGKKGIPDQPESVPTTLSAYGSASAWFPGAKSKRTDGRGGSINNAIPYATAPEDFTVKNYPTNEDEAVLLQNLGALFVRNFTGRTDVISVEPNEDEGKPGAAKVTLEKTLPNGDKEKKVVYTDDITDAGGLGEESYGFEIEGTRAEKVLEQQNDESFPKVSTSLEAFSRLSNRRRETQTPPETIVLSGSQDSTKIALQNLGAQFRASDPAVSNIKRIVVIANASPLEKLRPRYANLRDVVGPGKLVDFVPGRVSDVGFENQGTDDPKKEPLVVYGQDGRPVQDPKDGGDLKVDAYISCAGYKDTDDKYSAFMEGGEELIDSTDPITLPTNKDIIVGAKFKKAPFIKLVGVKSPYGINKAARATLPIGTQRALARVGENVVAIGLQARLSTAAANVYGSEYEFETPQGYVSLEDRKIANRGEPVEIVGDINLEQNPLQITGNEELLKGRIPADHVRDARDLLSSLIAYEVGKINTTENFTGELDFIIRQEDGRVVLRSQNGTPSLSQGFVSRLEQVFNNPNIQVYLFDILNKQRRKTGLELALKFRDGQLEDLREAGVE